MTSCRVQNKRHCPECGGDLKVRQTDYRADGTVIRRRHCVGKCKQRYTTAELTFERLTSLENAERDLALLRTLIQRVQMK